MSKKILFFLSTVFLGLGYSTANGQNVPFRKYCATDSMTEVAMKQYPEYARKRQEFMQYVRSLNAQSIARINAAPQYTIPIVVHIIHTYGGDNITDAQVHDAVRVINDDYQKLNADTASIIPVFQPLNANVGFQFRLARKDPNGNCTNGITRTYSTLTNSAGDNVKQLVAWNPDKYLNIWVVENIASGAGGYSYLPCGVPRNIEGIVIRNSQFGSVGRSANGGNLSHRSLTHEIGHYMGLPHTWGGSNTPGVASNCGMDDGIADTPNTIGSSAGGCNTNMRTCNPATYPFPDNVQNYMDYADCGSMFTLGQKAVMVSALTMFCRSNLITPANLLATGTNDGYTAVCAPLADFNTNAERVCAGNTVSFADQSYNIATGTTPTYSWTFPGGTPATSTAKNPQVTYNTPGIYSATLVTTNAIGMGTVTKTSIINVRPSTSAETAPYTEGFESGNFPNHPTNVQKSWEILNPGSNGWEATNLAAATGTTSVRMRNSAVASGTVSTMISPAIDGTNISGATIKYKVAYSQKTSASNDNLTVSVSKDCGATWTTRQSKSGAALSSTGTVNPGNFVPTAAQWRQETVVIPASFLVNNLLIRFQSAAGTGANTVYVDDIQLTGLVMGVKDNEAAALGLNIYPNPSNGDATVNFTLPTATDFNLEVLTVTGQRVGNALNRKADTKQQDLKLSEVTGSTLSPGVYMVKLTANGFTTLKKAIVF